MYPEFHETRQTTRHFFFNQSNCISFKVYKTLAEQSSASLHSVFKAKLANENIGFQEETDVQTKARGSTSSDESEGIEMKERESELESTTPPPNEPKIDATVHVDMTEISQNNPTAASSQDTEDSAGKESDGTDVTSKVANEAVQEANSESSTEGDGSSTASYDDDVKSEDESDLTWPPAPETETDSKL